MCIYLPHGTRGESSTVPSLTSFPVIETSMHLYSYSIALDMIFRPSSAIVLAILANWISNNGLFFIVAYANASETTSPGFSTSLPSPSSTNRLPQNGEYGTQDAPPIHRPTEPILTEFDETEHLVRGPTAESVLGGLVTPPPTPDVETHTHEHATPSALIQPSYDTSMSVDTSAWSYIPDPAYGSWMPPLAKTQVPTSQISVLPEFIQCLSSWADYHDGWTTYLFNTTFPPKTTVTTVSMKNPTKVPFSTLCDNIPRAPSGVSEYLEREATITQAPGSIGPFTTNTVPVPTCTIAADECIRVSKQWRPGGLVDSGLMLPGSGPCQNHENCDSCQIHGRSVELMYWPASTGAEGLCAGNGSTVKPTAIHSGPSTMVRGSLTLTSPSVYLSFGYLFAVSKTQDMPPCGQPTLDIVVSMPPESLSSIRTEARRGADGSWTTMAATRSFDFADFNTVPKEACQGTSRCWSGPEKGNHCNAVYDDYQPHLIIPDSIKTLVPFWKNCDPGLEGALGPPIPLTGVNELLPATFTTVAESSIPQQSTARPSMFPAATPSELTSSTKMSPGLSSEAAPTKTSFGDYTDPVSGGSVSFRDSYMSGPSPEAAFEGVEISSSVMGNASAAATFTSSATQASSEPAARQSTVPPRSNTTTGHLEESIVSLNGRSENATAPGNFNTGQGSGAVISAASSSRGYSWYGNISGSGNASSLSTRRQSPRLSSRYLERAATTSSYSANASMWSASPMPSADLESKASRSNNSPRCFAVFKVFKEFNMLRWA